jgi:spermidine/putrescine-binding protein
MMKDAPGNKDKLYEFLSDVNDDPEVAKYIVNDWGYGHANAKAMEAVDPEVLKAKGYADVAKFVDKTLFQAPVPADLKSKMIAEFEKIKSGY